MRIYIRFRICVALALCFGALFSFPLAAQTVWEGIAAQGSAADFPVRGQWALTNDFPAGTVLQITNLANNNRISARVIGRPLNRNYFLLLSAEAARNLDISAQFPGRVTVSLSSNSVRDNANARDAFSVPPYTPSSPSSPGYPSFSTSPGVLGAPPEYATAPFAPSQNTTDILNQEAYTNFQRNSAATPERNAGTEYLEPQVDFFSNAPPTPKSKHKRIPVSKISSRRLVRRRNASGTDTTSTPSDAAASANRRVEPNLAAVAQPISTPGSTSNVVSAPNVVGSRLAAARDNPRLAEPGTPRDSGATRAAANTPALASRSVPSASLPPVFADTRPLLQQPGLTPASEPEPTPTPLPAPEPAPASILPGPTPTPAPTPTLLPEPEPAPVPEPAPEPAPASILPGPTPTPAPTPTPLPEPEPAPAPEPTPTPPQSLSAVERQFRLEAAAPRPAPLTSLPEKNQGALNASAFYIQIGAFRNIAAARGVIENLQSRGYSAFIYNDQSRLRYLNRILIGPVPTDEIGSLLVWIRSQGFGDAFSRRGSAL